VTDALPVLERGTGAPPVVLLHGFTQTARCWGPFGAALARHHRTLAVDLPGHGGATAVRADLSRSGDLAVAAAGPAVYLGYSMGGRVALHAALRHPSSVRGLVLIGATAGLDSPAERAARRDADERLAGRISGTGVDAFLDEWLSGPLFEGLDPAAACVEERRANTAEGLASSLVLCGTGTQDPLWDRLGGLTMPVLAVVGGRDEKFGTLAGRLVDAVGSTASVATVDLAGHAAHLERPEATATVVLDWLDARFR
jgi:2-succinyl-6-hydroxy-2,4-cyclohexadiene-1-carboxylate synthase